MKILLIAYHFPPLPGPGSLRPARMAKYLQRYGHDVSILTQAESAPQSQEADIHRIRDVSHNCHRSGWRRIQWLFLRLAIEFLNRAGIYASIYSLWRRAVMKRDEAIMADARPQAIIATYPPVETLEIGLNLSQKYSVPLIADFRDGLLFEAIESKRLRRFACVRRAYAAIERRVAAESAALITVSDPLHRYFQKTFPGARVLTVANGFDPDESVLPLPAIKLEPECFHIVHSGRFALSDATCSIAPLVEALTSLIGRRPELARSIRLHLLGELSRGEKRMLRPLLRRGVVRLHGTVDRLRALAFQRRADLLLLVTSPLRSSVATTKIFEYLQARRPVLALTAGTFAAEIIAKTRCGWTVSPQAVGQILDTIEKLTGDQELDRKLDLSPAAVEKYSIAASMQQLSEVLHSLSQADDG